LKCKRCPIKNECFERPIIVNDPEQKRKIRLCPILIVLDWSFRKMQQEAAEKAQKKQINKAA